MSANLEVAAEDLSNRLFDAARAFLLAANVALREERVLPRPVFDPHIRVGSDYFGPELMPLPEFQAFERAIEALHPRFTDSKPLGDRDVANAYVFSFLEACVSECTRRGEPLTPDASVVPDLLRSLESELRADEWEVACCRVVSHVTTVDGEPVEVAGVRIVPNLAPAHASRNETHRAIDAVIPYSASAFGGDPPFAYAPPQCVVIARGTSPAPFDAANEISGRIERFLLLGRLLRAATCQSLYEVQGETSRVRRFGPTLVQFRGTRGLVDLARTVRRTLQLSPADDTRFCGLWELLVRAEEQRPEMVLTSFGMALTKFQASYHASAWHEQLVDLATAFEGALSGSETTDVVLRLRTRAAALLATSNDSARRIFDDVGTLYFLRSRLVHGGELKRRELERRIRSISIVPEDTMFGIAVDHAIDRLRDLVRRALLARICLAAIDEPVWQLGSDPAVDAELSDDATRRRWRDDWHGVLTDIDAAFASDRPAVGADFLSPDEHVPQKKP